MKNVPVPLKTMVSLLDKFWTGMGGEGPERHLGRVVKQSERATQRIGVWAF